MNHLSIYGIFLLQIIYLKKISERQCQNLGLTTPLYILHSDVVKGLIGKIEIQQFFLCQKTNLQHCLGQQSIEKSIVVVTIFYAGLNMNILTYIYLQR